MAVLDIEFRSEVIGLDTGVKVIMPHRTDKPAKVIYLLHGLQGNRNCWIRETDIFHMADDFAIIMPEVGRSFYTDTVTGQKYFTFLSEEIPQVVGSVLNISKKREDTFAMGYSMGGYGAVKLALRCPDKIRAAVSLSGVLGLGFGAGEGKKPPQNHEWSWVFGTELRHEDDVAALAADLADKPEIRPDLFFSCGTEDFLYKGNVLYKNHLEKIGYPFKYEEFPGEHPAGCTDERIKKGIDFIKSLC